MRGGLAAFAGAVLGGLVAMGCGGSLTGGGTGGQGGGVATGRGGAGGVGGPCWSASDCTNSAVCQRPDDPPLCGICVQVDRPCTADTDCTADAGSPRICAQATGCTCGGMGCFPGCTQDTDCAEGMTCAANHHCVATPGTPVSSVCPIDFTCGTQNSCVRKTCQTDSECSGACVLGTCYHAPGTCRGPVI